MVALPTFKSQVLSGVSYAGSTLRFFDFIDKAGPNGGRNIIDGMWVHAIGNATQATTAVSGLDLPRVFGRIVVEEIDGTKRWNLPGDSSRIAAYAFEGADRYVEQADFAVGTANFAVAMYIPFMKRFMHTPEDYCLPADMFKEVAVDLPIASDIAVAGGTWTINSWSYYCVPEMHEDFDTQIYCSDVVAQTDFTSTAEATISLSGKMQDCYFHARGAGGGASLSPNFTDARCDALGQPVLARTPDLKALYRRARNMAGNLNSTNGSELRSDPFVNDKATALFIHDPQLSSFDGKVLRQAKLNLTNTVASLRAITREAVPTSQDIRNRTCAAYGLKPSDFRVMTDGKSKRDSASWPKTLRPFLRLKAGLKKAA